MNAFDIAATALLVMLAPVGVVLVRRRPIDALVALELAGAIFVLALLCFAEGFHRSTYYGVAVVGAALSWISGLVYAHFLGRWL